MTSPTQRTLKLCRKAGWDADVVEKWIPQIRQRRDLFKMIDVLCLSEAGFVGIQTTSGSNVSARVKKIKDNPLAMRWLECGGRILIHGWSRKKKSRFWSCREIEITKDTLKEPN